MCVGRDPGLTWAGVCAGVGCAHTSGGPALGHGREEADPALRPSASGFHWERRGAEWAAVCVCVCVCMYV